MDDVANASELRWMSLLYGATAGLSCLIIVEILVWLLHFRGGFAWQAIPSIQFNWHPLLMVVSFIVLYAHGISILYLS